MPNIGLRQPIQAWRLLAYLTDILLPPCPCVPLCLHPGLDLEDDNILMPNIGLRQSIQT